ncbi:MAG: hypothetical protein CUN55_14655 [Phototrophicales bacterium]|nr:MAG: hypothetical protein CUN55_14655 [Phototrophicales bacterium]
MQQSPQYNPAPPQYGQQMPQYGQVPQQMQPRAFPYRIKLHLGVGDYIVSGLFAFLVIIFTFGIASFFYPYGAYKFILNRIYFLDGSGAAVAKLHVDAGLGDQFVHLLLWLGLVVITFGLAGLLYQFYAVPRWIWSRTQIVPIQPMMLPN